MPTNRHPMQPSLANNGIFQFSVNLTESTLTLGCKLFKSPNSLIRSMFDKIVTDKTFSKTKTNYGTLDKLFKTLLTIVGCIFNSA